MSLLVLVRFAVHFITAHSFITVMFDFVFVLVNVRVITAVATQILFMCGIRIWTHCLRWHALMAMMRV
jgi:hypothetical protein